jgi:voltage-gated potassium channel
VGQAAGTFVLIALITFVYYVLPVPHRMHEDSWAIIFGCGAAVLGALILLSIRKLLRAGAETRVRALVLLLCVTVLFFSWADVAVAEIPGQFVSLHTKTDGLYFSVSTLATVGFGDVHASGQLARVAVTLQIVFNLVFLGAAVGIISSRVRARAGLPPRRAPVRPDDDRRDDDRRDDGRRDDDRRDGDRDGGRPEGGRPARGRPTGPGAGQEHAG